MKTILTVVFSFFSFTGFAQDFDWWRNNVNWDGSTHWWKYLIISPKYFGPNALPVPSINNGSIDSLNSLGAGANLHFSKGDNTRNLTLYGNFAPGGKSVSIDVSFIPYEHFNMTHATKEERKIYYQSYYKTSTVGDVVVNTNFHILERWRETVQLAMRVGVRMPSGGEQGAARYTDGPGYWIDMGMGKPFHRSNFKLLANAGFYVWQTNSDALRQNDAFMFGAGVEWNRNNWRMQGYAAGYVGYKDNGDKPVLLRLNLERNTKKAGYFFRAQQGLNDFDYTSMELGARAFFRNTKY